MKFIHLADLHLGKSLGGQSLIDSGDQIFWVEEFLKKAEKVKPDAVVIAGDVYDRSAPSGDAVNLFDQLLVGLNKRSIPVLMVAGNHDSGQRLSFAKDLLEKSEIYISGKLEKDLQHVEIPAKDGSGSVVFWMVPYVFPALVSQKLEDDSIREYEDAMRKLLEVQLIDRSKRNVLIAHQNVTANGKEVERGGSESMVGGVGQIDYQVFDAFDYVALGHIHAAYPVGRPAVRYAGSPLYYHFDELKQAKKGPLLVEIGAKDGEYAEITTTVLEIPPLHPLRIIRGTYDEIRREEEKNDTRGEYLRIVLTDQKLTPQINDYFRKLFDARGSVVLERESEYRDVGGMGISAHSTEEVRNMSLEELFAAFYSNRKKGEEVSEADRKILHFADMLTRERSDRLDAEGSVREEDVEKLLAFVEKETEGEE